MRNSWITAAGLLALSAFVVAGCDEEARIQYGHPQGYPAYPPPAAPSKLVRLEFVNESPVSRLVVLSGAGRRPNG